MKVGSEYQNLITNMLGGSLVKYNTPVVTMIKVSKERMKRSDQRYNVHETSADRRLQRNQKIQARQVYFSCKHTLKALTCEYFYHHFSFMRRESDKKYTVRTYYVHCRTISAIFSVGDFESHFDPVVKKNIFQCKHQNFFPNVTVILSVRLAFTTRPLIYAERAFMCFTVSIASRLYSFLGLVGGFRRSFAPFCQVVARFFVVTLRRVGTRSYHIIARIRRRTSCSTVRSAQYTKTLVARRVIVYVGPSLTPVKHRAKYRDSHKYLRVFFFFTISQSETKTS